MPLVIFRNTVLRFQCGGCATQILHQLPLVVGDRILDGPDGEHLHAVDLLAVVIHRCRFSVDEFRILQLIQRFGNCLWRFDPDCIPDGLLLCLTDIAFAILQPHEIRVDRDRIRRESKSKNLIRHDEVVALHVLRRSFQSHLRDFFLPTG